MASINVHGLTVDLPIIGHNGRSIRKFLVNYRVGGKALKDQSDTIIIRAVDNLNFKVSDGERLGLYGHNGAGKTTILRVLAGIYHPTKGLAQVNGTIASLLESSFGLNFDATGRENITLLLTYRGFHQDQILELRPTIEEFTELGSYLELPVRTYSSGMLARLGFGVATCFEPEVLLMDEWLGAGDDAFMRKAKDRLEAFVDKANVLVLASHSRDLITKICNKVLVVEQGRQIDYGAPEEVFARMDNALLSPVI
jgi:ABC-type polysaccharide/polyol phosphate transport system ATPase subunit